MRSDRSRGAGRSGPAWAFALAASAAGCDEGPSEPVPTLVVRSFEVPEIPTDAAVLGLDYVLPSDHVPGEGHTLALTVTLTGPEGLASLAEAGLAPAEDLVPAGEPGQVGAWWLPELSEEGPQDELDGTPGRRVSFDLGFAASETGTVSAALTVVDVAPAVEEGGPSAVGDSLRDLQYLRLVFRGGDEEAEVTTPG